MRLLVIGLGAVGQRHVRNLRSVLGAEVEIIAYRARGLDRDLAGDGSGRRFEEAYRVRAYADLDEALSQQPAAALICNPTSLHVAAALAAARAGCHLFIEKPVSHTKEGLEELKAEVRDRRLQTLVGFQFRFHPGLIAVSKLIKEGAVGRVIHAKAHWGEYLPNWHPWEDYRESYSARSDLGGGVILTLCHPLDYLRWMLGEVRSVFAVVGRDSGLGIDVEDAADMILNFESGATGMVHLDYVQRPPAHWLQVMGCTGTIVWDNETGCVRLRRADCAEWQSIFTPRDFERNTLFQEEIRHFLECVIGRAQPIVNLEDGVKTLEVALAAKSAAAEARVIEIAYARR